MSIYARLGVRRVVNACGIYTDLGGSLLTGAASAAAREAEQTWAAMDELLAASGVSIASLCGCPAARVVPGASAGIALAVGACVARGDGSAMEALPHVDSVVLMQRGHEYKYARCAALAGARVEWVENIADALAAVAAERGADAASHAAASPAVASPATGPRVAAVLHPAHLDGAALALDSLAPLARAAGVPVVVDAAYQSFPLAELRRWSNAGDVACFSAKYFFGPNAGGFVAGQDALVAAVGALDFVGYESGPWRTFGRAFKLDRATVAATVVALEEWVTLDHDARWHGYGMLAQELATQIGGGELMQFTLEEELVDGPANAVVVRGAGALVDALADGDPSVRAMADGDDLVFCTEALTGAEVREIGAAMSALWPN